MPRQSRLDTPGALHHIIARGNERRKIFEDKKDCKEFLIRLGDILSGTETICYAWAIIPNHFHLFLRTGSFPIATIMRRLGLAWGTFFTFKHLACEVGVTMIVVLHAKTVTIRYAWGAASYYCQGE